MHRFVWDLRGALPEGARRSFRVTGGPWVVPGDYTVKLTVAGKTISRPLTVKMDPRSRATPEALQLQFVLASRLGKELSEVSAALRRADELRKQVEERKKDAAANAVLLAALDDIAAKIALAAGPEMDPDFGSIGPALPDREHEPLRRVSTALSGLLAVSQSADSAPSPDVMTAAQRWEAVRTDSLAQWNAVLNEVRDRVNPSLEKTSLKPLTVQ
jgi:hypothetical protein